MQQSSHSHKNHHVHHVIHKIILFWQRQITELEAKLLIKDAEMAELRQRLIRNGTLLLPEPGGKYQLCACADL